MVAAGTTPLAFNQNDRLDFSEMFFQNDRFILRVSGDSMVDAHIKDGDFVVVQKQDSANVGQMVVAQTATGETLKYWHPEGDRIRLQPANKKMQPIYVAEATVVGVAVGVVRSTL